MPEADRLTLSSLDAAGWKPVIEKAIQRRHASWNYLTKADEPQGLLIFELRTGTGYGCGEPSRIDAFHLNEVPSKGLRRFAYEMKVSRADFLREIKQPQKRRAALRLSNQFAFITPPGVVKVEELPLECGLIEVAEDARANVVVEAPWRDGHPPTWMFVAALCRRMKGLDGAVSR